LEADEKQVQAGVAAYERKLSEAQRSGEFRDQWLSALARGLREQNLLGQLEGITRRVAAPTQEDLRAYYESHPELFTEPERVRLGLIVIGVDPASPIEAWAEAQARAKELVRALAAGADFAELARRHSSDASAGAGGDLGYRHRGRLPQGVEREIDRLQEGAISEPIRLLEGIAVLRLVERKPARLKGFEDVHRSAADLWAREQGEVRWRDLIASLRSGADIRLRAHPPVAEQDRGGAGERAVR
jgi:parvulin-like peptidyl-prolyl isomerase